MRKPDPEMVACYIKLLPELLAVVVFIGMCAIAAGVVSNEVAHERIAAHQAVRR